MKVRKSIRNINAVWKRKGSRFSFGAKLIGDWLISEGTWPTTTLSQTSTSTKTSSYLDTELMELNFHNNKINSLDREFRLPSLSGLKWLKTQQGQDELSWNVVKSNLISKMHMQIRDSTTSSWNNLKSNGLTSSSTKATVTLPRQSGSYEIKLSTDTVIGVF